MATNTSANARTVTDNCIAEIQNLRASFGSAYDIDDMTMAQYEHLNEGLQRFKRELKDNKVDPQHVWTMLELLGYIDEHTGLLKAYNDGMVDIDLSGRVQIWSRSERAFGYHNELLQWIQEVNDFTTIKHISVNKNRPYVLVSSTHGMKPDE